MKRHNLVKVIAGMLESPKLHGIPLSLSDIANVSGLEVRDVYCTVNTVSGKELFRKGKATGETGIRYHWTGKLPVWYRREHMGGKQSKNLSEALAKATMLQANVVEGVTVFDKARRYQVSFAVTMEELIEVLKVIPRETAVAALSSLPVMPVS